jgi:hypothetical protein
MTDPHWCLAAGIVATICANLAHGMGHGPIGALVSAWPALALAGSFELLMALIRSHRQARPAPGPGIETHQHAPKANHDVPAALEAGRALEQSVLARHQVGHSQRAIARELNIDRRKVKRIIDPDT